MRDTCAIVLLSKELCSNELLRPTSNLLENGDTSDKLEQLASDSNLLWLHSNSQRLANALSQLRGVPTTSMEVLQLGHYCLAGCNPNVPLLVAEQFVMMAFLVSSETWLAGKSLNHLEVS